MNKLSTEKRAQIAGGLVEGMSMRAISRTTGAARNTIDKLLIDLGTASADFQDVVLRNLDIKRVEADEIWSFCHAKAKNVPADKVGELGYGDVWTWVAIDADTKLVPSWLVGDRGIEDCYTFLADLRMRVLVGNRIQLTTDGLGTYPPVVDSLWRDNIDYAVIIKDYGDPKPEEQRKYSPAKYQGADKRVMAGSPNMKLVSTSYVERQNLTMRMGMRRYTRSTNGFSKKIENHAHAVSLHFMPYNFCRPHQTLAKRYPELGTQVTPAMAAGVERHPWSLTQLVDLLESN